MRIETEVKLDFKDVLIKPKRSTLFSRKEVDLTRTFTTLHAKRVYEGLPLIAANMDSIGTFDMANALLRFDASTALHKHYSVEQLVEFFNNLTTNSPIFYSMGVREDDYEKFNTVKELAIDNAIQYVCIDVANGYSQRFSNFITKIRDENPDIVIMAGNVVTAEMTEQLILAGADIVKVGIGPGSVCTTRKVAGVGYPQLSAIIECADAAHGLGGLVCGDGGCTTPGDVAKAFGAGADFVMLGGMLAGHDECGGDLVTADNHSIKIDRRDVENIYDDMESAKIDLVMKFYGMSSKAAMTKHHGGVAEYRASEGKEVLVPYRGKVENTIKEITGGVRSACTYVGARKLKELSKRTTFVMVNRTHNTVYGE